mmetsp:Transcript_314/g.414  ORF Transcript_314/g.414 Transcript_314/m.414 type:complete len:426 (-) Transcript_314:43-1320(-)
MLPDSFGVIHIGETFTAYLGALNVSKDLPIRRLTVTAQLQTPSRRWPLHSALDASNNAGGIDVTPGGGLDAIVSRSLEEVGQHILRVEVGYSSNGPKTLRKFYRFNVSSPLNIRERTMRAGDASCFVSIAVANAANAGSSGGLTVSSVKFHPSAGLVAERIGNGGISVLDNVNDKQERKFRGAELFDGCGRLDPGESFRYVFLVKAASEDATLRGIACGDELGKAVFTWNKAMGETGRIASTAVLCPSSHPPGLLEENAAAASSNSPRSVLGSKFVVHGSGLSVDAAAAAANRSASHADGSAGPGGSLDELLPVTVEPIDPPTSMELAVSREVQLLIVNHSEKAMNLQLQMRLPQMSGVVICGSSFKNLGEVPPSGGSCVVSIRLVALVAGLFRAQGCCIVDLTSGREMPQPPLFNVFVEKADEQ